MKYGKNIFIKLNHCFYSPLIMIIKYIDKSYIINTQDDSTNNEEQEETKHQIIKPLKISPKIAWIEREHSDIIDFNS